MLCSSLGLLVFLRRVLGFTEMQEGAAVAAI